MVESSLNGEKPRKIVLGLGNLLFSDEGFGIHALQHLQARLRLPPDVEWVDGGVMGMNLLPLVEECSHLLVLDAINANQAAGSIIELNREQMLVFNGIKLSEHQASFQDVLGLAYLRGRLPPRLHMIGLQPADLSLNVELSDIAIAALPRITQRAAAILHQW
jgi:hydrogenase maturation protease